MRFTHPNQPSRTAVLQVLKMYETLVAETDSRFSEAEVVFKERQQQQHSFNRFYTAPPPSIPVHHPLPELSFFFFSFFRSRAVDKKLRELMAMFYTQPVRRTRPHRRSITHLHLF